MRPRILALCALLPTKSCVAQWRSCESESSPRSIFSMVGCDRRVRLLRSSFSIKDFSWRVPFSTSTIDSSSAFARNLLGDVSAQGCLSDLADIRDGQFANQLDSLGPFELSDTARGKELAHRDEVERIAVSERQIDACFLTEHVIGHRDHRGGVDGRMSDQVRFDFLGADFLAAAI